MTRSHAMTLLCLFGLLIAPACNDDGSNTDEVGETGDGDSSTTGEGDSTSEGDSSTTTTTSTDADTTESTSDTTDSTDSSGTDSTDSTTGEPDNSTYSAVSYPGGLDRVIITRLDPDEPSCSEMVLVKPGFDMYDVTLEPMWGIEQVRSWDQLECDSMTPPDSLGEGGVGTIEFLGTDAFDLYPCALAIDVEVDMDTDPPSTMIFATDFVLVDGVNCG
ncbi:hypothetical protein ACNOYE_22020 [Nannocystaceae bacterium ST9]